LGLLAGEYGANLAQLDLAVVVGRVDREYKIAASGRRLTLIA
jgi:hypothetical protein